MTEYWYMTQKFKLWSRNTKPVFWEEEANLEINEYKAKEESEGNLEFFQKYF